MVPGTSDVRADITNRKANEDYDKSIGRIPLREIFISVDIISEAADTATTVVDFIEKLLKILSANPL